MSESESTNSDEESSSLMRLSKALTVRGRSLMVRLEPAVWQALEELCRRQGLSEDDVVSEIDRTRGNTALVTAIRTYLTRYFKEAADRDRPHRGLSESLEDRPTLSPAMLRALDSIAPLDKGKA